MVLSNSVRTPASNFIHLKICVMWHKSVCFMIWMLDFCVCVCVCLTDRSLLTVPCGLSFGLLITDTALNTAAGHCNNLTLSHYGSGALSWNTWLYIHARTIWYSILIMHQHINQMKKLPEHCDVPSTISNVSIVCGLKWCPACFCLSNSTVPWGVRFVVPPCSGLH